MGQDTDPIPEVQVPPPIRYPCDVIEIDKEEEEEIMIVGTDGQKITHIGKDFHTQVHPKLRKLVLRSHMLQVMEGVDTLHHLQELELYDNEITELQCLNDTTTNNDDDDNSGKTPTPTTAITNHNNDNPAAATTLGSSLLVFDMSFNKIRNMKPVEFCPNLKELYLANNKLKSMAGLRGLSKLQKLDLGSNRLRVMDKDELSGLQSLEELWLGKNKIEHIEGIETLTKLRRLDVQSNRLLTIENLSSQQETLEELYIAQNAITTEGLSGLCRSGEGEEQVNLRFPKLSILDLICNKITNTAPLSHLTSLEELWLSGNQIETWDHIKPLSALSFPTVTASAAENDNNNNDESNNQYNGLETIYLEMNPIAREFEYRKQLAVLIPSLKQIDATIISGKTGVIMPGGGGLAETFQQFNQRLQSQVILRAKIQQQEEQKQEEEQQSQQKPELLSIEQKQEQKQEEQQQSQQKPEHLSIEQQEEQKQQEQQQSQQKPEHRSIEQQEEQKQEQEQEVEQEVEQEEEKSEGQQAEQQEHQPDEGQKQEGQHEDEGKKDQQQEEQTSEQ